MDDPWGSPWMSTSDDKGHKPPPPVTSDLEPPPRALLSTTPSPRVLPTFTSQSPWIDDDDDGFGDWASADATATQAAAAWASWEGTAGANPGARLTPTLGDDALGKARPIAWLGSVAASPGAMPRGNPPFPQPSPDPWASEFSPEPGQAIVELTPPSDATEQAAGRATGHTLASEDISGEAVDSSHDSQPDDLAVREWDDLELNNEADTSPREDLAQGKASEDSAEATSDVQSSILHSRRDSHSSDKSSPSQGRQDSPITSVDEDAKTRPEPLQRKASSKVQELVDMYDGLTKTAAVDPAPLPRDCGQSSYGERSDGSPEDSGEPTDFGDFEDARGCPAEVCSQEPGASSDEQTPTPKMRDADASRRGDAASGGEEDDSPAEHSAGVARAQAPPPAAAIHFELPLEILDKLPSGVGPGIGHGPDEGRTHEGDTAGGAAGEIPDRVVSDSFGGISERKTWYRISRQGTSRKHNAGDDENYVRVAWQTSAVREETIKVVRRWMEEDSITGRPTLGGGPGKGNMFGWDSKAEPVALHKFFGRKQPEHSRSSSLDQPKPTPTAWNPERKLSGGLRSPTQRPSSMVLPAVASFGWSSGGTAGDGTPAGPTPLPATAGGIGGPVEIGVTPASGKASATRPAPQHITAKSRNNEEDDDNDEEDEWGEMVGSPSEMRATVPDSPGAQRQGHGDIPTGLLRPANRPDAARKTMVQVPRAVEPTDSGGGIIPQHQPPGERHNAQLTVVDPWDSADFSLFESGSASGAPPLPAHAPQPPSYPPSAPGVVQRQSATAKQRRSSEEMVPRTTRAAKNDEQELRAREIINSLPSLSYMLR